MATLDDNTKFRFQRPKYRFHVHVGIVFDGAIPKNGYLLLDHEGRVWRNGKLSNVPYTEYFNVGKYGKPRATWDEAVDDTPEDGEIITLTNDDVIVVVSVKYHDDKQDCFYVDGDEATRFQVFLESGGESAFSLNTLSGGRSTLMTTAIRRVSFATQPPVQLTEAKAACDA